MYNFKLIAIRPLVGCNKRFIKNLTPGHIYQLYNGFDFRNEKGETVKRGDEVASILDNSKTPENFFSTSSKAKQKTAINVSAIAGKNGSGKSSLIEFMFAALYVFSVNNEKLNANPRMINSAIEGLKEEKSKLKQKQRKSNTRIKSNFKESADIEELRQYFAQETLDNKRLEIIEGELEYFKKLPQEILRFQREYKGELYFQFDKTNYRLELNFDKGQLQPISRLSIIGTDHKVSPKVIEGGESKHILENLFYTIAVNNSHFALNSQHMGDWINQLFHKNDGYTAPLVINPMRTNGDFEIIPEMKRAKYRLLTNVLRQWQNSRGSKRKVLLTDKQYISKIRLDLNHNKVASIPKSIYFSKRQISGNPRAVALFKELLPHFYIGNEVDFYIAEFPLKDILCSYIVQKFDKIAEIYPWFGPVFEFNEQTPFILNSELIDAIKSDQSHITYKLRQAFNFLHYNVYRGRKALFHVNADQLRLKSKVFFEPTPKQLIDWMNVPLDGDLMHFLPPSFFDIDFVLDDISDSPCYFNDLSSGEQQKVHTIQSVIYHLNNLQSVHAGKISKDRIRYRAVNIVFDEIELYFHPDYQRKFLMDLLSAVDSLQLQKKDGIQAINILFLTHSPFILSDIPRENILLLKVRENGLRSLSIPYLSLDKNTFAANINDLLADGFFLKGTLMGSFAEEKIKGLISKINENIKLSKDEMNTINLIGDDFLNISLMNLIDNKS